MNVLPIGVRALQISGCRFGQLAGDFGTAHKVDALDVLRTSNQRAGHITQISSAAHGAAHHCAETGMIKVGARHEFAQDVSKEPDANREKFRQRCLVPDAGTIDIIHFKPAHLMRRPEVPCPQIVRGHSTLLLELAIEFVKKMSINPNPGRNSEIALTRFAVEVLIFDPAKRYTANAPLYGGAGGFAGAHRNSEIMSQGIGGSERQYRQRHLCPRQFLDYI